MPNRTDRKLDLALDCPTGTAYDEETFRYFLAIERARAKASHHTLRLLMATIERALRSRDQWQPGSRLDSWAYRIMRNQWIDTVRSRSRKEKVEAPAEEAERIGEDPTAGMDASIDLSRMMAAMERLPDEQREVVALILIEGFGYRETAEMLGLPIGTVSSRLVRGRTALLEMVGA
jgi:RNA polymerase sigma-70 factor (ECF subfamily)